MVVAIGQASPGFRQTVVIVDDSQSSLAWLESVVRANMEECAVHCFTQPREALSWCLDHEVDVVVVDYMMPELDGLGFIEGFRRDSRRSSVPVVMVTSSDLKDVRYMALQLGATDFLGKPVDEVEFITRVRNFLLLSRQHKEVSDRAALLADEVDRATHTLVEALTQTVSVLSRALEMRDPYTNGHQKRVSALATAIAVRLGLPADMVTGIRLGSLIHDVGKIAVPAELLSCPRRLTPTEMELIRSHSVVGRDIVSEASFPWPLARMVAEHHERIDGTGYPLGLKGEEICLEARIIAVADVVEAMSSHRPYRPAVGIQAAVAEIQANRGRHFDPRVVDACVELLAEADYAFWS